MRRTPRFGLAALLSAGLVVAALVTAVGGVGHADSAVMWAQTVPPPPTPTAPPHAPKKWPGLYAVLLVVDAARADELDPARMPNLAALEAGGTSYSQAWVGQLPSVTETSHATLGTGVLPSHHTILGDTWRVPGTEQMSPNLLDSALTRTGYIGRVIQQTGVPTIAGIVHAHFPNGTVATLSGHKIYAADALGAGQADYVGFGTKDSQGHFVPAAIPGRQPAPSLMTSAQLNLPVYPGNTEGLEDTWATTFALKFLFKYHPRLLMVNLPQVDIFGHVAGTDATVMQPALAAVDNNIGRIVAAYRRAGMLGQTYFIVTADHGMVPAAHIVDSEAVKSVVLKAGGNPLYIGHGDDCKIWIKNAASIPRVAAALSDANIPYVSAVYERSQKGKYRLVSPVSRLADPSVAQAQLDLLKTFDQGEAPDIVLTYDENTITMTPSYAKIGRKGDHGGSTWGAQHIPLIVSGPGIRAGYRSTYPARLVDIAPSIETFLGATPVHQDGVPLADAMVNPPVGALQAQDRVMSRMVADVSALEREALLRPNTR